MKGNFQVRFLEGDGLATARLYSAGRNGPIFDLRILIFDWGKWKESFGQGSRCPLRPMPPVKPHTIACVEPMHRPAQVRLGRFQQ